MLTPWSLLVRDWAPRRARCSDSVSESRIICGIAKEPVDMTPAMNTLFIVCIIAVLAGPAIAQTEPREYDLHPPTLSAPDHDLHDHVHAFVIWQTASFIGGAVIARLFVDASLTSILSGGLIGGFMATAVFISREFGEHVMSPRQR